MKFEKKNLMKNFIYEVYFLDMLIYLFKVLEKIPLFVKNLPALRVIIPLKLFINFLKL